ncbi:pyridoxamine 5'-phosphate oxidase family protein [Halocatena pleomorpha]|uniref:Pyridoxamine 5'-phosphate oxidase family protein n=1 Tax=Halocatena pleomorpha TaxID=1785090 RepID=A0A3P3R873_9EURY|nr:pyridoxamine 5'-phosphate oxidase family protein [Halocatena pleomorpha]RRJ29564.1 pyridoxamine 5'-phosphate oxidase family protein [Halocatena pleomorpha]
MDDESPTQMNSEERDKFLETRETGVISFSRGIDSPPQSIPISYGYDQVEHDFYFRLAPGTDNVRADVTGQAVTFVTYEQTDDGWRSVIASGQLEDVEEESIATETLAGLERVHIPLIDMFGVPPGEIQFGFYRLDPDSLTGRKELKTEI